MDVSRIGVPSPLSIGDRAASQPLSGQGGLGPGFAEALKGAIQDVNEQSKDASHEVQKLMTGEGSLHRTMIAMQDAAVGMDMVVAVRNKVVEAYQEVMRMPV